MAIHLNNLAPFIEQQENLQQIDKFFFATNRTAISLRNKGCFENVSARILSLVQAVVSVVAVVFCFFAMIIAPIISIFCNGPSIARQWAKGFASMGGAHLFQIPASLIGFFFPSTLVKNFDMEDLSEMLGEGIQQLQMQGAPLGVFANLLQR